MARPREFDEAAVLERAMQVFWSQGYEATSIDDLCRATELNRSSLYQAFGSKRALLDAALDRYDERAAARIGELLDEVRPIQAGVRAFLTGFVDEAVAGPGRRGCFIGNCVGELAARDAEAAGRLAHSLQRIEAVIHAALKRAQRDGELAKQRDARALARFLTAQAQGLRLVAKANPDRKALNDIVDVALQSLQ